MIGVVLAAGNGIRLKNSQNSQVCKPLIQVDHTPLIHFSLENLRKLHIDRACIVVGSEGDRIREAIGDNYQGIAVTYATQQEQKGLIHALMQAVIQASLDAPILLQLSDEIILHLRSQDIENTIQAGRVAFFCGVTREENPDKIRGNYAVTVQEDQTLHHCQEKPKVVTNVWKGTGFCYFSREAVALLKGSYCWETNQPRELCDYLNLLVESRYRGVALEIGQREFNINTAADLAEAEAALRQT